MTFDFNPNMFNELYWHLSDFINDESIRHIWVYGGSSSSKTYSVVQAQSIKMLSGSDENAIVLRKYATDIRDSIYSDFKSIISGWGLDEYFTFQQNYIRCNLTGSYVRFRGLDDSEKVKGISSFKRVILEEVSQFEEEDHKQIRKRLRGRAGQQIIGIFNPIDEQHWIKASIFDNEQLTQIPAKINAIWTNESGNTRILKTNYLDNIYVVGKWEKGKLIGGFLDQHTIDEFEKDKSSDFNYYQIYALGNWGKLRTGGEFYKQFKPEIHVGKATYKQELPLHISWDDNVNPYLPCGIFQIEGRTIYMIDEIAGESPNNTVKAVCNELKRKYPSHKAGMFVYGDATAQKQDTKMEKGHNFYTLIMQYLAEYKPVNRVSNSNPSVVMRGNWINTIFETNIGNIYIVIGENCIKTITDFVSLKEAADGTKHKEVEKNSKTGIREQKYGHFTDLFDYLLTTAFKEQYNEYLSHKKPSRNWRSAF